MLKNNAMSSLNYIRFWLKRKRDVEKESERVKEKERQSELEIETTSGNFFRRLRTILISWPKKNQLRHLNQG